MTHNPCSFDLCDRPVWAKGLCNSHYTQQHKGKQLTPLRPKAAQGALHEAVERGLLGGRACVMAGTDDPGRPIYNNGSRGSRRHSLAREVWVRANGNPGDLWVLHACHNDRCVNIDHLYAGTAAQNTADREAVYQLGVAMIQARMALGGPGIGNGGQDFHL